MNNPGGEHGRRYNEHWAACRCRPGRHGGITAAEHKWWLVPLGDQTLGGLRSSSSQRPLHTSLSSLGMTARKCRPLRGRERATQAANVGALLPWVEHDERLQFSWCGHTAVQAAAVQDEGGKADRRAGSSGHLGRAIS